MRRLAFALASAALAAAAASAEPAESEERLTMDDGASLYLELRGEDAAAPLLVWLHGGPGGAERPLLRYFTGALEAHFVVAYLDQRGAGRSYDEAADPRALTIARHLADLGAVLAQLRGRFPGREPTLIGHSWGGALALLYAADHPAEIAAVLAVAPLVNTRAAQRAEWEFAREEAQRRGDDDVLAKLGALGPPPYDDAEEVLASERIAADYGGVFHDPPSFAWTALRGVLGGLVTPWEIPRFIRANEATLEAMHEELLGLDLATAVPRTGVPVAFLLGRHDRHADARIAAAYFERLRAPRKRIVWFEGSAHNPPFEEPERFVREAVETVRALTKAPEVACGESRESC
jgi:proline iminopeptidase